MKILHISTYDIKGGAALAAYRLHRAMLKQHEASSCMLVLHKESRDPTVVQARLSMSVLERVRRKFARRRKRRVRAPYSTPLSKVEMFSDDWGGEAESVTAKMMGFDVVQLHWIAGFLDYGRFFGRLPEGPPIVWRLADMNPFTGGCHYDGDCGRFEEACGCCPKLDSGQEHDLSHAIWRRRKAAVEQIPRERLHVVALNRWMAKQVRRSSLFRRFDCSVIPNGVDLDEFKPIPPPIAREALGIPDGRQVVAFVAESTKNERKGFHLLLRALDHLRQRRNLFLLIVGEAHDLASTGLPSLQVGHVQSVPLLRQIYSAAHAFVIPSLEDNQPNTVLEAMACGTPVVGFKTGGIPEMVEDGQTGLLVPRGDIQELARAIEFLLDHDHDRTTMAACARRRIEEAFTRDDQVRKYFELYSRLTAAQTIKRVI